MKQLASQPNSLSAPLLILLMATALVGCVNQTVKSTSVPAIQSAPATISEHLLLDVGIPVFNDGVAEADEEDRVYPEVRKAEARYMPNLLSKAIQDSGSWGAVRVIPSGEQLIDVVVQGTIVHSDGEQLELHVLAKDASGRIWLDKPYKAFASRYSYEVTTRNLQDPFQAIYHMVANDLLQQQLLLSDADRLALRTITDLRFAQSFSPEAFDGYLQQQRNDGYRILRLPATDDPMLERVHKIREKDYVFIDELQNLYGDFNDRMNDPYQEWRKLSYQEAIALRELKAESNRRLIAGVAAVVAGVAAASAGDSGARAASDIAILGGGYLLKSGLDRRQEAEIHVQALEELSISLESEVTEQIIELDDRTVLLSGDVEELYSQWRELLTEIYRTEVGELELMQAESVSN